MCCAASCAVPCGTGVRHWALRRASLPRWVRIRIVPRWSKRASLPRLVTGGEGCTSGRMRGWGERGEEEEKSERSEGG